MNKAVIALLVVVAMAGGFGLSKVLQQRTGLGATDGGARPLAIPESNPAIDAVDFSLRDLAGTPVSLSSSDGQVRVLNFWATWCAPCRREIPVLKALAEEHRGAGIAVLGLAVDELEPVRAYANDTDFNYPILMAEPGADAIVTDYGLDFIGLPLTLIVAPNRELVYAHAGELKTADLEEMLPTLLQLAAGELDAAAATAQIGAH